MQRLLIILMAAVLLGRGQSFAQSVTATRTSTLSTPSSHGLSMGLPNSGTPGAVGTNTLGAIQGNLAYVSPFALGSITPCPATGVASAPATADAAASDSAAGMVVTPPVVSPLGLSSSSNTCTTTTLPVIVTPSVVSGATFADGAVPLDETESGQLGMSPLIAVPAPEASTACVSGTDLPEISEPPTIFDSSGSTSASAAPNC
jgi:hypothetical protein